MLPARAYETICHQAEPERAFRDPVLRRALGSASVDLVRALARVQEGAPATPRLRSRLLRYLIRMATRPTPYGLLAGVGLAAWGDRTDLTLDETAARSCSHPDMDWLFRLVLGLESDVRVRGSLRLSTNPEAFVRGGRVYLREQLSDGSGSSGAHTSVRATAAVVAALRTCRRPTPHTRVRDHLLDTISGATSEKVERLIDELLKTSLLQSDLRPCLTGDPVEQLSLRLDEIPEASDARLQLEKVRQWAIAFDANRDGSREFDDLQYRSSVASDLIFNLPRNLLAKSIGADVARAAELMLTLTPFPNGYPGLEAYRSAFETRYGHDRVVSLLELLDPNYGLGLPSEAAGVNAQGPRNFPVRDRTLWDLANEALHNKTPVIELTDDTIKRLQTWNGTRTNAPLSLDLYIFVCAQSQQAIDSGDYQVVIGPNIGAMAAGRNLGRFAAALGEDAVRHLEETALLEQSFDPEVILAELVYLPRKFRSMNVCVRPGVRDFEILVGTMPSTSWDRVIPLEELAVRLNGGLFELWWPSRGAKIVITSGHMLNYSRAPAVCRFLADVSLQGKAQLHVFDWGPAANLPFLPRVQSKRIVLRPAEWRLFESHAKRTFDLDDRERFYRSFSAWKHSWNVPKRVYLSAGDNRLLLDLEEPLHLDELLLELRRLGSGGNLVLQEPLPDVTDVWTKGVDGTYFAEFVVPLIQRSDSVAPLDVRSATPEPPSFSIPADRIVAPGGDWLYLKLYAGYELHDDLIAGPLRTFAEAVVTQGLSDRYFFLRYSDPDPHIRLRFKGNPERLVGELFPEVCTWARALIAEERCLRFSFDTYERELERYGGVNAMDAAEQIFFVDSRLAAALLDLTVRKELFEDRTVIAAVVVAHLLESFGLDRRAAVQWCDKTGYPRNETTRAYRDHGRLVRSALNGAGMPEALAGLGQLLDRRHDELQPAIASLKELERAHDLNRPLSTILQSIVHMFCNRFIGNDKSREGIAIGLVARAQRALLEMETRPARTRGSAFEPE